MDYDSSSKFISSLSKFLQSLCNGYVDFNNGVEVIGHIYINIDTGEKIDYVLNERMSKTEENSVTFVSNSFHAQPAEKPKRPEKKNIHEPVAYTSSAHKSSNSEEMIIESESDNTATLLHPVHVKPRPSKRPHQQMFSPPNRQQKPKVCRKNGSFNGTSSYAQSFPINTGSLISQDDYDTEKCTASNSGSANSSVFPETFNNSSVFPETLKNSSVFPETLQNSSVFPETLNNSSVFPEAFKNSSVFPETFKSISTSQQPTEDVKIKVEIDKDLGYAKDEHDTFQPDNDSEESKLYGEFLNETAQRLGQIEGTSQEGYQSDSKRMSDITGVDPSGKTILIKDCIKGMGFCPVEGCSTKFAINQISQLKTHWKEKHERIVAQFHCSACGEYKAKRKSNVHRHYRERHDKESKDYTMMVGHIEMIPNKQFVNPYPYTYYDVFD